MFWLRFVDFSNWPFIFHHRRPICHHMLCLIDGTHLRSSGVCLIITHVSIMSVTVWLPFIIVFFIFVLSLFYKSAPRPHGNSGTLQKRGVLSIRKSDDQHTKPVEYRAPGCTKSCRSIDAHWIFYTFEAPAMAETYHGGVLKLEGHMTNDRKTAEYRATVRPKNSRSILWKARS